MREAPSAPGWHAVVAAHEIVRGLTTRKVGVLSVVLYRTEAGVSIALEDRCSHIALPLSDGRLEGDSVRCLYHGLLFDSSGRCVQMRGQQDISRRGAGARVSGHRGGRDSMDLDSRTRSSSLGRRKFAGNSALRRGSRD